MRQKDLTPITAGDVAPITRALKRGAMLSNQYRIDDVLVDSSSFALTYRATDTASERETDASVAIKEFFPRVFVGRARDGHTVKPHSQADAAEFARSLRRFVHEGNILVDVAGPHLVAVRRCLEANGTGYLVMRLYEGRPLPTALSAAGGRVATQQAVAFVLALLEPLERLHVEGVLHRAISPDAVSVTETWQPILHGFSARRHVSGQPLDVVPGFGAFEQYASNNVGPWTDVYACAALLYHFVTGLVPPAAIDRAAGESLPPASTVVPDVSPSLSLAIARGMSLLPEQRPHGVAEFRKQLESGWVDRVNVPASPRIAGSTFDGQVTVRERGIVSDIPLGLELAAGGRLVLPRAETVAPRFQRILATLTERARDGVRRVMPEAREVDVPSYESTPTDLAPESVPARLAPSRQPDTVVQENVAEPVPALDSVREASVRSGPPEGSEQREVGRTLALITASLRHQLTELSRNVARRRATRYVAASLLTVAVIGTAYGRLAHRGSSERAGARGVPTPAPKSAAGTLAPAPSTNASSGAIAGKRSSAQLQGALSDADSTSARTVRGNSTDRSKTEKRTTAASIDRSKQAMPVDVLTDVETRLASGKEEADLGLYSFARRIFRSALQVTDAALTRFAESDTLRALRAELNQADLRALRACQAENESLRKRGQPAMPCE